MTKKIALIFLIIFAVSTSSCSTKVGNEHEPLDDWSENTMYELAYLTNDSWEKGISSDYSRQYNTTTYGIALVYDLQKEVFSSVDDYIEQAKSLTTEEKWLYTLENYNISEWKNEYFEGKIIKKNVKLKKDFKAEQAETYDIDDDSALVYQVSFTDNHNNLVLITAISYSDDNLLSSDLKIFLDSFRPIK